MPYNLKSKPVSKGGNRGINKLFSRNAAEGKFRVVGVSTFDESLYVIAPRDSDGNAHDFDTLNAAARRADEEVSRNWMLARTNVYEADVYDDKGKLCYRARHTVSTKSKPYFYDD